MEIKLVEVGNEDTWYFCSKCKAFAERDQWGDLSCYCQERVSDGGTRYVRKVGDKMPYGWGKLKYVIMEVEQ